MKRNEKINVKNACFLAIFAALLFAGCATNAEVDVPPDLDTYDGLADAIEDGANILIYDVRTAGEFETGYISGARNVPYDVIGKLVPARHRNRVIVVYCASGGRSAKAYQTLTDRGFKYVFDFGGIGNWQGELAGGE